MKVIGINGSSRESGNTAIIIETVFKELEKQNIQTEMIQLFDKDIHMLKSNMNIEEKEKIRNDDFNDIFKSIVEADGIILGSPLYEDKKSYKMRAFMDRVNAACRENPEILKHKVGASIAAVCKGVGMSTVDILNHFLLNKEVYLVGSTYWNMVYGTGIGDVLNDKDGMKNMRNLGENMAWILNKINK